MEDCFFIHHQKSVMTIPYPEILYLENREGQVRLVTTSNIYLLNKSFKQVKRQLPAQFVRVHRDYIVSLDKVAFYHPTGCFMALHSSFTENSQDIPDVMIPVGKEYKSGRLKKVLLPGRKINRSKSLPSLLLDILLNNNTN